MVVGEVWSGSEDEPEIPKEPSEEDPDKEAAFEPTPDVGAA